MAFSQKETKDNVDDAKLQEVIVVDANKKGSSTKAKQTRQVQVPPPSVNNYPGAAAQNNIRTESASTPSKQKTDDGLANYQIGMQFYVKEEYSQAVSQLNRVLAKQNKGVVYENALWYLANSYLKLGKKQDGQALLQRIVTEKGKYATQAAAMLK